MRACILLIAALAACTTDPVTSPTTQLPAQQTPAQESSRPSADSVVAQAPPSTAPGRACGGSVVTVESIEYGAIDGVDPNMLSLDVHSPAAPDSCPAVIWVHGGSWQAGDKVTSATELKARHFVAEGFVFVSVNYRLVSETNDVRWPDFGNDVAAAAAWVIDNASELGVDAQRIALVGHSAGAHLVSIVGTNPDLLAEVGHARDEIGCVVSLDSVTHDLTQQPTFERDIVEAAFGDDVAALTDGSPTLQAAEHPDDGPLPEFLIVTRGRPVRLQSAAALEAALLDAGASASVYDASPYDHRDVNVRIGEPDESIITPVVTNFLAGCFS